MNSEDSEHNKIDPARAQIYREEQTILFQIQGVAQCQAEAASRFKMINAVRSLESGVRALFADEDRYLSSIGNRVALAHVRVHRHLLAELTRHGASYVDAPEMSPQRLMRFLNEWLVPHLSYHERARPSISGMNLIERRTIGHGEKSAFSDRSCRPVQSTAAEDSSGSRAAVCS